jgi:hypothetical protein
MKRGPLFVFLIMLLAVAGIASAGGAQEVPKSERVSLQDIFAPSACSQSAGVQLLDGPADNCCGRRGTICEVSCTCGIEAFNCGTTSTGGCLSTCKCFKCV